MFEIVGVGSAVYDTLIVTNSFPVEDTKIRAKKTMQSGGGPCSTGLVAAAKLGASCAYIGVLSDDAGGKFLLSDFEKFNVDVQSVQVMSGYSSFSSFVILNEDSATRTCVAYRGDLPELVLDEAQKQKLIAAKLLMVDGNELNAAIEAATIAKANGVKVLYDAGGLYQNVETLLPLCDILIPSEEFALGFTGEKDAETAAKKLFTQFSPEVVVITQGKRGGILYDGTELRPYPILDAVVVDSNGAGDVFHGAFAYAVVQGYNAYQSCLFSSAASAIKCTKLGARNGAPTRDEVINLLRRNGYEF
jgi:Sugar kinases, ribokinase family